MPNVPTLVKILSVIASCNKGLREMIKSCPKCETNLKKLFPSFFMILPYLNYFNGFATKDNGYNRTAFKSFTFFFNFNENKFFSIIYNY